MIDYFCDRDAAASGQGAERRCLYLVFEYMDTTLWREFSRSRGLFDRQMVVRIFRDVCLGMKHLHDVGIVHTDLSLTNMLYSRGQLKVADLGCSSCAATWVLPNTECGTAHSRAPELWLSARRKSASRVRAPGQMVETVATAVDCWSLGVCLGILLTGELIFQSFADIVSCLGPLTDAEWAGCTSLPGYATYKVDELSSKFVGHGEHVLTFFSSQQHVKYPKPIEDSGLDLIRMFLKWPPNGRCTVKQSLDHRFFGEVLDFAAVVRTFSHEQLGKLVVESIRNGVPVCSADILAAHAPPVSPQGTKRPLTVDGRSEAAEDVSPGKSVCTDMVHYAHHRNTTALKRAKQTPAESEESRNLPSGVQGLNASLCACRGLCRRFPCVKACNTAVAWIKKHPTSNRRQMQICDQPRVPGFRFCFGCKCEVTDCDKSRDKSHVSSGRWCYVHGNSLVSDRKRYPNNGGQQVYGPRWNLQLRLTARLAFLLRDMMPQDMTAAFDFGRRLRNIRPGQSMRNEDLMWMVLASALERAVAIDVFWHAVAPKLDVEPTAEVVSDCVQKAIDAVELVPEMHADSSVTGRAVGPLWLGVRLGVAGREAEIAKTKGTPRRRLSTKVSSLPRLDLIGRLVAMRVDLEWPVSNEPEVVQAFARRVLQFVGKGFQITGETPQDAMFAAGISRKVLLATSEVVPALFDKCIMGDIVNWTHDEGEYADPLKSMNGAELRSCFGMQPLMIGFWTSHFACCEPREQQALQQAEDTRLLHVLAELRNEGHGAPTPQTIARRLLEPSDTI